MTVDRRQPTWQEYLAKGWAGFVTALKGMRVTIKYFFRGRNTVIYPYQKLPIPNYYRGRHRQRVDANGIPWCIACNACARICPDQCITIVASRNDDPPDSKRRRKLDSFVIDLGRCMYCGLCAEACPQQCLMLVADYEYAAWHPDEFQMSLGTQLRPEPISEEELLFRGRPELDPAPAREKPAKREEA